MTDTFEKTYTDWSIDVGEYKYEGITLKEVEQNLYSIQDNDIDFLIISPSKAISCACCVWSRRSPGTSCPNRYQQVSVLL